MNSQPLVTVVTVCRNNLPALQVTMQSVAEQTYANIEYLIIDGASTDGTAQMLAEYQGRLSRWISEPDKGIYDAMNKAIGMATGDWIIFMNAGDTFASSDVLSRVFSCSHEVDVIYGDVVKGEQLKYAEPPHNAHRMYFCHQSALVRTECLRQYPFDTRHRMSADFKQMKMLFLSGHHFLQLPFAIARFDTTGISNVQRSRGLKDNIMVVREVDSWAEQLRLLPKLYWVYWMCRLRGK